MGRENKKEAVAAFHREQIIKASESLFSEKGFEQTTVDDISRQSGYSRRTVYAYFESKEDILNHIVEKGLISLKGDIESALTLEGGFFEQYKAICDSFIKYHGNCPRSFENVSTANTDIFESDGLPDTLKRILKLGTQINSLLADYIKNAQERGIIRREVNPLMSVYILWSELSSLITLADTKGKFICNQFSVSKEEFLDYGFRQIINSVLEQKIQF